MRRTLKREERLLMLEPREKSVVVMKVSESGVDGFKYLRDRKPEQREVYFINEITPGPVEGVMLLGQFLFEFENCPQFALPLTPGRTNRTCFPSDHKVDSFEEPTVEEKKYFVDKMTEIANRRPMYASFVSNILESMMSLA